MEERREAQPTFASENQQRAGIEVTISAGAWALHSQRSRSTGLTKTHLKHVLIVAAMNLIRICACLGGTSPAQTRQSAFIKLVKLPIGA
ncbi:transposase [Microvirga splendida]|uniref:transposase n=1 Tax=Microvirga splendida TaxID=2795727 RepID=UPI001FEF7C81|nr:transposase [Microvirga splendida]